MAPRKEKGEDNRPTITDPRFARVHTDPRFVRPKKQNQKVVVDDRFKSAFEGNDDDARKVDRFGRKLAKNAGKDELRRFYRLEGDDGKKMAGPGEKGFIDFARGQVLLESSDEGSDEEDGEEAAEEEPSEADSEESDDEEVELGNKRLRRLRAESEVLIDLDEDGPFASTSALPDEADDGPEIEPTRRLAVVNMDWDHLLPLDLYKVFASVVSPTAPSLAALGPKPSLVDAEGNFIKAKAKELHRVARGTVKRVVIYKSQFGKERMAKEDLEGPPREIFKGGLAKVDEEASDLEQDDEDQSDGEGSEGLVREDEGDDYDEDALRKYQLDRLRYYYAIVELDSAEAGKHVYDEVHGTEFERTANVFDLSFVPEDMTFDDDDIHDVCQEDSASYQGVDFVTDALRHSKVKLTWDAEDPHRAKVTRLNAQKLSRDELAKIDFDTYLASASDSESEPEVGPGGKETKASRRERMRRMMGLDGGDEGQAEGDMEITFAPALSSKRLDVMEGKETSLDVYKRKEKERREKRKLKGKDTAEEKQEEEVDAGFDDEFFKDDADLDTALRSRENRGFGDDDDESRPVAKSKSKSKLSKAEIKAEAAAAERQRAELSLLVDSDSEVEGGGRHFNMNDIIKAEKGGKKKKLKGEKAKRLAELKDEFQIDAGDKRFVNVLEDHEFAIDPSNPHFKKTKNMDKLLVAASDRRKEKRGKAEDEQQQRKAKPSSSTKDVGIAALVASVKRKADKGDQGREKRRK